MFTDQYGPMLSFLAVIGLVFFLGLCASKK